MATISFDRPMIIKDDKAAAALIKAATCKRKPIEDTGILRELERGLRLLKEELSH
jgi:hypothetical protein